MNAAEPMRTGLPHHSVRSQLKKRIDLNDHIDGENQVYREGLAYHLRYPDDASVVGGGVAQPFKADVNQEIRIVPQLISLVVEYR